MILILFLPILLLRNTVTAACSRTVLRWTADSYIFAQRTGNPEDWANIADNVQYLENNNTANFLTGFLSRPQRITHSRSIYDTTACALWTELVIANSSHPRVIATQMWLDADRQVAKIDSLISEQGDWLFNASAYQHYASAENWNTLPASKRSTRTVLKAAADAYCDYFMNRNITIPYSPDCIRIEGGEIVPCVGRVSPHLLNNRRYVIDETLGAISVFLGFGGLDRGRPDWDVPDSHTFRLEAGQIRYIHTVSICSVPGCGVRNVTRPTDHDYRKMRALTRPV